MLRAALMAVAVAIATVAACAGRSRGVAIVDGCAGVWQCTQDELGPRDCVCVEK